MDPQAPNIQDATTATPIVPEHTLKKSKTNVFPVLSVAIFIVFALGTIVFQYYQNQQLKNMLAKYQSPIPSSPPISVTDTMANWKTVQVTDTDDKLLGIEYKVPNNIYPTMPKWANSGHYYKDFGLPAPSQIAIIPVGQDQGYQKTYKQMVDKFQIFDSKQSTLGSLPSIEITPKTKDLTNASDLLLLSDNVVNFRSELVKINDHLSLLIIHYYDNKSPTTELDFQTDEKTFDQILSTFKFTGAGLPTPTSTPKVSTGSGTPSGY